MKRSLAALLVLALFGGGPGFAMLLCGCSGPPKAHCCCEPHEDEALQQDVVGVPCHTVEVERAAVTLAEAPPQTSLSVPTLVELPVLAVPVPTRIAARAPERVELPGAAPPYLRISSLRI